MQWYSLSLISLFLFSTSSILQRKLLSQTTLNPVVYGFSFQVLVGIMAIPIFILNPGHLSLDSTIWSYIIIASVFYATSNFLLFRGIKLTEISQVSIIGSTKSLWVLFGSAIILEELITPAKVLGVLLIIVAIIVVFWQNKTFKLSRGHVFILGAAIFSGIAYVVDGLILRDFSASFYLIISSLATGFGTLAFSPKSVFKIHQLLRKEILVWVIFTSIIFAIAVYLLYSSYQIGGTISSIIPITQSAVILTVILAAIFLKETSRLASKIIASIISAVGIYLLR